MGLPVICLDDIWQTSWSEADVPGFRTLVSDAHASDAWISDGNFARATFDIRLARADLVVWLEIPRMVCALRAVARVFRTGEAHKLRNLPRVLRYIRNFDRINRMLIENARADHGPDLPIVRLSERRTIDAFIRSRAQA
jgi:adenylate kinase family enzyme